MKNKFPKKVELIGVLQHPTEKWHTEDYASTGARGCFDEKSSADIQRDEIQKEDYDNRREIIFRETSGRGHGAVLDHGVFVWSIDNLTRASTLFLCAPQYASHLQQSLRRTTAERGFEPIKIEEGDDFGKRGFKEISQKEGNDLMQKQFDLYGQMIAGGVPTEDARIILPLNAKTTIHTLWNARELMHLKSMAKRMNVTNDTFEVINKMYSQAMEQAPAMMKNREKNLEVLAWMPSSQLYAGQNIPIQRAILKQKKENREMMMGYSKGIEMTEQEIKEAIEERDEALLANLKHTHFTFLTPMSLMSFHQATRQRTWDQSVEPIYEAIWRGQFVTPPTIENTEFKKPLEELFRESREYITKNMSHTREAIGATPHALEVYDLIHVNGWNALHSIGKRRCKTAQWEIRDKAKQMAKEIKEVYPELGKYCLPQGMLYGYCPERENCGWCKKG
jgi:thymidylate synthase ThyX